jgi:hypothetical protein
LVLRGQYLYAAKNLLDGLHVVHMLDESYGVQDLNEIARNTLPLSGISKVSLLFNLNLEGGGLVNQLLENRQEWLCPLSRFLVHLVNTSR